MLDPYQIPEHALHDTYLGEKQYYKTIHDLKNKMNPMLRTLSYVTPPVTSLLSYTKVPLALLATYGAMKQKQQREQQKQELIKKMLDNERKELMAIELPTQPELPIQSEQSTQVIKDIPIDANLPLKIQGEHKFFDKSEIKRNFLDRTLHIPNFNEYDVKRTINSLLKPHVNEKRNKVLDKIFDEFIKAKEDIQTNDDFKKWVKTNEVIKTLINKNFETKKDEREIVDLAVSTKDMLLNPELIPGKMNARNFIPNIIIERLPVELKRVYKGQQERLRENRIREAKKKAEREGYEYVEEKTNKKEKPDEEEYE